MKKYIYTIVAATAMLASCSQDAELNGIIDNQSKAITEIGATTSAGTRAVISSSDNTKVNWESGDQIGAIGKISSGDPNYVNYAYTLNGAGGSTSGTFKNDASPIEYVSFVMYPYQSTANYDDNDDKLTCEIPTVQTATAGSFDKAAAIMYQFGTGGNDINLTLDYAVAFLKVNIPSGTTNVHAITVYSSTALSGKVDITYGFGGASVTAASSGSQTYVTLQADATNGALADGKDYYIAVKPDTLENLSIAYKYTDHTAKAKQGGSNLTLAAGHVKTIKADFTSGTVHEAKQLWADGPYFATVNVGETTETGNTQTYMWGATAAGGSENTGDYDLDHDTAYKIWGSAWRMPINDEFVALNTNKSSVSYGQLSGTSTYGFTFQGASGYGSIFLPANGGSNSTNGVADYWSATPDSDVYAYSLDLMGGYGLMVSPNFSNPRYSAYFVRAVLR